VQGMQENRTFLLSENTIQALGFLCGNQFTNNLSTKVMRGQDRQDHDLA
jgi:hypothetical protein